jgi:hypothetical protein
MTSVSDFFVAGLEQVRESWGWFLVFGNIRSVPLKMPSCALSHNKV